ncbi:MAG: hypothetical protein RIR79_1234 [Pseudomonadota bacterium]|jgi:MFS family permease
MNDYPQPSQSPQLWLRLVPAYALGYFLSYGLRSVNAVIAPDLMREMGISAVELGMLTSAYFLAFGLFQLPLGVLLDRFGPRRVEAVLLLVAAGGCALFAVGNSLQTLVLARALIGLGVSACLMASFKAFSQWFEVQRLASLNATVMVAGGLGALSASVPIEMALPFIGWRGIFMAASGSLVLAAGFLWTVPDQTSTEKPQPFAQQLQALGSIYRSRIFWRFAPLSCLSVGSYMALQGLWAVPWMMEVAGLTRSASANVLLIMSIAMLVGFLLIASGSIWLARQGIAPRMLFVFGMVLALVGQLGIVLELAPSIVVWSVMGFAFSFSNIAYPQLTAHFDKALSGRVNTALNLIVFLGAFGLQWGVGALVDWFTVGGMERVSAFRTSFALLLAAQGLAFIWFWVPIRERER